MKKLLQILFLLVFFLGSASPQDKIHRELIPERLISERLLEMQRSNTGGENGIDNRESLLLKFESTNWKIALRNKRARLNEVEGFDSMNPGTTLKKTLLRNGFLLIETISQSWKDSVWVNRSKHSTSFDGNNKPTVGISQTWDGSAWVNSFKDSSTYIGNNQTEWIYQTWDSSAWVNYYKYSYTYDGRNNLIEYIQQTWDGSEWVNKNKNSYTYDGNNNQTEWITQTWDGSIWVVQHKASYTYDGSNHELEGLTQIWNGSVWINSGKVSYTYDGNYNQTGLISQIWNGSTWVNSLKVLNTYDANNNQTEVISQNWDGSLWVNFTRDSKTYDSNNNQTELISQIWNGSTWGNSYRNSFTYDGNNNLTGILSQYWAWQISVWENEQKILYIYAPVTAMYENLKHLKFYSLSNNYPNPFNPTTKIKFSIPNTEGTRRGVFPLVDLKVYDMLGNEIATLVNEEKPAGNYEVEFSAGSSGNAATLPSGIYFYQLKTTGFNEVKKMLLVK